MRSGNPALSARAFEGFQTEGRAMTMQGTVNKTALLLGLTLLTAMWVWNRFFLYHDEASASTLMLVGAIGGFVVAMVTIFMKKIVPYTAPVYALLEGLFVGGLSAVYEAKYPGVAVQAVGLTFATLAIMLFAYRSGLIRVTEKLKMGVVAATGAIFVLYLIDLVMSLFGHHLGFIYSSGPAGIGFSLLVVGVAAFNLLLDFDFIEQGAAHGAPKYMEWYGAFALLLTLVWLYIEMLRLLGKTRR